MEDREGLGLSAGSLYNCHGWMSSGLETALRLLSSGVILGMRLNGSINLIISITGASGTHGSRGEDTAGPRARKCWIMAYSAEIQG